MRKCWVFSNQEFNKLMKDNGWTDGNTPDNAAFISICDPFGEEPEFGLYHWFRQDADNVINLDFADIESYTLGKIPGMSELQAKQLYEFINRNLGKDFYIHCAAGVSRSQGVAKYIVDTFPDLYPREESLRKENPCEFPNIHVSCLLKHENFNNSRCAWS